MRIHGKDLLPKISTTSFNILFSLFLLFSFFSLVKVFETHAASVSTAVTVGNSAPSFTAGPAESPASTATTPTNVGSDTTWTATASENNGENYYLIICSSDSVTPVNGNAPTCGATTFCVSTATADDAQATCSRTALTGDAESIAWYAFVCDGNAQNASCSSSSQGTGDSGSPFEVNHVPGFTLAEITDSTVDPGVDPQWTTTASDGDTSGTSDTVKLLVCKTAGISAGACTGDTWCESSFVASNPTCSYDLPSVIPDASFDAYVYVVDSHNLAAGGDFQGDNIGYTVNNVAPVVSAVTLNGGSAISLTENSTKAVTLTATISDNNSCASGEIASVVGYAYRSSVGYTTNCDDATDADNNDCYPEISCTAVTEGNTCTGNTDASVDYTCSVNIYYYADPTDTATIYVDDTWLDTIKATDDDSATHNETVATGVEMSSLTAASITNAINYGNLGVDEKNDPLDQTTTTTPTGNVGLDQEVSGSANMCTDYPTCSVGTPIGVAYQKYSLTTSTAYASGTALSTSATETELNVPKATSGSPTTKDTWWGILIPTGTIAGTYSGANTLTAVKGETASW